MDEYHLTRRTWSDSSQGIGGHPPLPARYVPPETPISISGKFVEEHFIKAASIHYAEVAFELTGHIIETDDLYEPSALLR